jgi:hypothetical protein
MRLLAIGLMLVSTACLAQPAAKSKGDEDKQRAAPERLLVHIKSVLKRGDELVADAEVKKVHRSQAGVKAGEAVRIMYRYQNTNPHFKSPAGDIPFAAVEQGRLYDAYLQKRGAIFVPVGGELSFTQPR